MLHTGGSDAPVTTGNYIDGVARPADGGRTYALFNPARPDELVGHAALSSVSDVDAAVRAAHGAFAAWSRTSYAERAAKLNEVAEYLESGQDDVDQRARLFCREHGKPIKETHLEVSRLGERFRMTAAYADRLARDEIEHGPPFDTIITRQPRGVAMLIVPWNWPLSILGAKLPQALMAGNTVVVKPSELSVLAPGLTLQKIAEMFPPGVINIVTGDAAEIGDSLVGHPLVRFVNFTGSVRIGKHVMKVAADQMTPVTLELGGNDAAIVCADARLDETAFMNMYLGTFMSSGQVCMALKRLYVHRSRYDEVIEGLEAVCNRMVVGDGLLPDTNMGPVNNAKQLQIITSMIEQARSAGAEVRECGQVPDEELYQKGYFQRPALVINPDHTLDIVAEEQFGPALPVMPFDSEGEAVRLANDSRFGLCSSVWTEDRDRALLISRQLEAGYTYLNNHGPTAQDFRGPFGGFKDSGIGRNLGYEGIVQFQGYHSISSSTGWLF
ncbi:MAG TPA: aldehyde dehydrogenase [Alphaproteobacteria bacterium]|mgnify:CR=1 FL=1|jgi:acyl-CoA reductase-like NAD-dependent aldehyde dehydrogenase|nr:aldehyde dehydrogenase [Alphaproteobacteria bacterium]HBP59545.1 aldehyde dehydrogenase [Alphaproteobacteria bacterium]HCD21727.1 aldehyde dehydrogenase [Alphaproteobacteria bacterium]|tara:strand:- start:363 stop:1856 length:1494 start_codon:yes stop_codon:yes gene_type:complete